MSRYIRYEFVNREGLRIVDDNMSQHGEAATLRYVPGTTIRGLVISELAREDKLEAWKKELFSENIQFLNAYVSTDDKEMIPSPKGFYEDKTITEEQKEIQNVVTDGTFDDGMKRAGLGEFCYLDGGVIRYASVDTSSDLKIKINDVKRDVFRNEYITAGHLFVGYIRVEDDGISNAAKNILQKGFIIGNARSSGLGKCECINVRKTDKLPYKDYAVSSDVEKEIYMYLVSDMCMRNQEGELCGIDEKILGSLMGVENLEIAYASTSRRISGAYNRKWGGRTPAIPYYEKGSVFHLRFQGKAEKEALIRLMDMGIGICRNQGYGRILFLKDYAALHAKSAIHMTKKVRSLKADVGRDEESVKVVAKKMLMDRIGKKCEEYLLRENDRLSKVTPSQMGIVDSICTQYRYQTERAGKALTQFFEHREGKEAAQKTQKLYKSNRPMKAFLYDEIWKGNMLDLIGYTKKEIMGIPISQLINGNDLEKMKLDLISELIRYRNKKEA